MDLFLFAFVLAILSYLRLAALWSPGGKRLASWVPCMCRFVVFLSFSEMMSLVRCST